MKQTIECDEAEMKALADIVPVRVLRDNELLAAYARERKLSIIELVQIIVYCTIRFPEYREIGFDPENGIAFGELYDFYERSRVQFFVIHRMNYLVHSSMTDVYDILEREGRLRFGVKRYSKEAENWWKAYQGNHRKNMTVDAWAVLQDYLVASESMLGPLMNKVYTSLRDYMISKGLRDVELKGRIYLVFLLFKCFGHTFNAFFKEFQDACGADFRTCFSSSDITIMTRKFVKMTESLGVKVAADKYGYPELAGLDIGKSTRIAWAWEELMEGLRDEDLMDESALKAICYNPRVEEDYRKTLEEDTRKEMEGVIAKLGEKYNVKKIK